ncbi:hypothetical protein AArc1_4030 (plasmid) [Natrarchaeobaculum sulfurireducens]|uniref:DUF8030 domain-containing protein n=1 Tax=Natrarchaeobaculum sulfurireducens TaxID=2044521 RepID=A0A346P9F2_9EURY|nr:hypothetical protein AArc1_4030 [Natrarchaeobaculum sulfurireducens]
MSSQRSQPVSSESEALRNRTDWEADDVPQLLVPNDRSTTSIISFVEWVLVELTHENIGAEYRSSHLWGQKRTQYTAADSTGEFFLKRHHDARLGWYTETLHREELRTELVSRLSRSRPETSDPSLDTTYRCDHFVFKPI